MFINFYLFVILYFYCDILVGPLSKCLGASSKDKCRLQEKLRA